MEQTWFVTGSSRGLGRALVPAALDAGDLVAATASQPAQLDDLVADYGDRIRTIALDVTDAQAARSAIAEAHGHFGRLDVIVDIPNHLPLGMNAVEGSIRLDEQLLAEDRKMERREPLPRLQ